jgi:hypothetical protein
LFPSACWSPAFREVREARRVRLVQRRAARRAGHLIEQAEATLEEASGVIANGFLRLDREEWIRAVGGGTRRSAGSPNRVRS